MSHPDSRFEHPLGDLHAVDELDRTNLGVTEKGRANAAMLVGAETDSDSVVHPVNVVLDGFDHMPDLRG